MQSFTARMPLLFGIFILLVIDGAVGNMFLGRPSFYAYVHACKCACH